MLSIEHIRTLCSVMGIGEPLARLTTYRVGGPADILLEPANVEELLSTIAYLRSIDMPFIVLGNGSNILVSDDGYRGAAISLARGFSSARFEDGIVDAGAGIRLATFVEFCISHSLAGVEMLAGIPGTLGGAVIMNAGAYGGQISDHLVDVTVLREGVLCTLPVAECGFRYRDSDLRSDIVVSARFAPPTGDAEELRARRKELLIKRNAAQPTSVPNAGSIFKNPPGTFAARLIEQCGLKGHGVGRAEVSPMHANFILGHPGATAADILATIARVRRTVRARTGVNLELEILLVGFPADALEAFERVDAERDSGTSTEEGGQ